MVRIVPIELRIHMTHSVRRHSYRLLWGTAVLTLLPLCGCTPGPSFQTPRLPREAAYTSRPLPPALKTTFQGHELPSRTWWQEFANPVLSEYMEQALNHSPTLKASLETLREAHYALRAAEGIFYPQLGLGLSATREQSSGAEFGGTVPGRIFSVYGGDVTVGFYPDVFGVNRLVYREKKAEEDAARYEAQATALTLEGNVFTTAVDLAESNDEIAATESIVAADRKVLELVQAEFRVGAASRLDVLQQESQLASDEATLYPLLQSRDTAAHALDTLIGSPPSDPVPTLTLAAFHMPAHFALAYPSTAINNRPDVEAALATLKQLNAQVGESIASEYPLVEITGSYGHDSNIIADFLRLASRAWSIAGNLTYTIFSGGTLRAQVEESKAAYGAAFYQYENTVLGALGQIANAVRAVGHDDQLVQAEGRALLAATRSYRLARAEYRLGATSYLSLLQSEITYRRALLADVKARAQQLSDAASLEIALGGRPLTPQDESRLPAFHTLRHE